MIAVVHPLELRAEYVLPGDVVQGAGRVTGLELFGNYVKLVCENGPLTVRRAAMVRLAELEGER